MKINKLLRNTFVLLIFVTVALIYKRKDRLAVLKFLKYSSHSIKQQDNCKLNHNYVINNNLAQYSTYLIPNDEEIRVEALVQFKFKYIKSYEEKNDFTCVVKLICIQFNDESEETLELKPLYTPKFYWNLNKKLIFAFREQDFKNKIDLKNIRIAVIRAADYNQSLNNGFFNNIETFNFTQPVVLPYLLINYQVPSIIETVEPRVPSIALCVHYTYNIPPQIIQWIDTHLSFGVDKILFYDGTDNEDLIKLINSKNDNRLEVRPYRISETDFCGNYKSSYPTKLLIFLKKSCQEFHYTEFREKVLWRAKHDQLTSNDCFLELSQTYEMIGYYDLDEYIFPRSFNNHEESNKNYNCSKSCSSNAFNFGKHKNLYNYFKKISRVYSGNRNISRINSLYFSNSMYLIPSELHKRLMDDLGYLIKQIDNNTIKINYPLKLSLSDPTNDRQLSLIIEENDVDYLKYLHNGYTSFVSCIFEILRIQNINIDENFFRYLNFVTDAKNRLGKSVHFSKNVKTVFIHDVEESEEKTWQLRVPPINGHVVSHFRKDVQLVYHENQNSSIRNLNIDSEYLIYLLKKYANFCKNIK
jgi:hypothetical protein